MREFKGRNFCHFICTVDSFPIPFALTKKKKKKKSKRTGREMAEDYSEETLQALEGLKAELGAVDQEVRGREWITNLDDATMLRYLKGHKNKISRVVKLIVKAAEWRDDFGKFVSKSCLVSLLEFDGVRVGLPVAGTNDILESWPNDMSEGAVFVREYWPIAITGMDNRGRPVVYNHVAKVDFPNLVQKAGMDNMVRHMVYLLEKSLSLSPHGGSIMIIDLARGEGEAAVFQISKFAQWFQSVLGFVKTMAKIADPYYPETFNRIFFTRVHQVFSGMYNSMNENLASATREKVVMINKADVVSKLEEFMPRSSIPQSLGGDSEEEIPSGGPIRN